MTIPADLLELARMLERLAPDRRNPEGFHMSKSEIIARLRRAARALSSGPPAHRALTDTELRAPRENLAGRTGGQPQRPPLPLIASRASPPPTGRADRCAGPSQGSLLMRELRRAPCR